MKRQYLLLMSLLVVMALVISACGGGAAEAPAEEAAPAAEEGDGEEAAAEEGDGEEAAAEGEMMLADPIPFAVGEAPGGGAGEIATYPLEDLVRYEALDSYSQPEWMDALVEDGTLPPVEERLPAEPQVIPSSGMSVGNGVYGGIWRDFSAVPTEGWNLCAGQTQGWYGINYIFSEALVDSAPTFMRSDAVEPLPNLAKSWEWSEDGMELTMEIMEGVKWSDGEPFGVEDIMFTWEDNILDPNVNSWKSRTSWQIDGEDISLEQVDENTIKWTFPVAFPVAKLFDMDFLDFSLCPAHVLKPFHPTYNSDSDYDQYLSALPADDLPPVSLGPWVATEYKTDEFMVMRRNPYYWKVDDQGNQLPYLNEVTFEKGETGLGRTLGTMAGSIDHSNLENPSSYVEATKRAQEDDAHFGINWGPEALGFPIEVNYSTTLGVESDRDAELRKLFRDNRFRQAVAYALDRDGIAQSIIRGPFLRGFPGGIVPGASEFDYDSVVYHPYDPDSAKALLADLGFEDTDGNDILNWTEGPLAGDDLTITMMSGEDAPASGQVVDAAAALLREVGIQINPLVVTGVAFDDAMESGTWEMRSRRTGQEWLTPFTRCTDLAPVTQQFEFHREGSEPRELLPFEEELVEIVNQFCVESDSQVRADLMKEYTRIFTENNYHIGTVIGRYGLALAERLQNVPTGAPPFFYHWTWGNVRPEQMWIAAEDMDLVAETQPETLPLYESTE